MTTKLIDTNGLPLTLRRGTSPSHTFTVVDSAGAPKSLVGATEVTLAIASTRSVHARDLLLELGSGITHDGTGGVVTAAFTTAQTEALPVGNRWCELWVTDSDGVRDLVGEGICIVHDTLITVSQ